MKICPRCGYSNPDTAEFCERCRYYLPNGLYAQIPNQFTQPATLPQSPPQPFIPQNVKSCPRCGYINPPNANFCANCGYSLQTIPSVIPIQNQIRQKRNVKFPYLKFFLSVIIAYIMIALILTFL